MARRPRLISAIARTTFIAALLTSLYLGSSGPTTVDVVSRYATAALAIAAAIAWGITSRRTSQRDRPGS